MLNLVILEERLCNTVFNWISRSCSDLRPLRFERVVPSIIYGGNRIQNRHKVGIRNIGTEGEHSRVISIWIYFSASITYSLRSLLSTYYWSRIFWDTREIENKTNPSPAKISEFSSGWQRTINKWNMQVSRRVSEEKKNKEIRNMKCVCGRREWNVRWCDPDGVDLGRDLVTWAMCLEKTIRDREPASMRALRWELLDGTGSRPVGRGELSEWGQKWELSER